jgi:hypothetical protein
MENNLAPRPGTMGQQPMGLVKYRSQPDNPYVAITYLCMRIAIKMITSASKIPPQIQRRLLQ